MFTAVIEGGIMATAEVGVAMTWQEECLLVPPVVVGLVPAIAVSTEEAVCMAAATGGLCQWISLMYPRARRFRSSNQ